ncbi:MAG TPA: TetR/AcrR family transcriptional regulator [Candidatus Eisenbacteria bacterium]|jgi:AcrR family transcriptional regulator
MGTHERRRREREETRERILRAAREMFSARGYDAVTMRAIADAIEYTPTAIYHHFANKQALVTELCHADFDSLARHFVKAASMPDPVERIRAVGEAYLEFAGRYPEHYRFMFMTPLPPLEHGEEFVAQTRDNPERDAYAFLRRACEEAIEQKRLRPEFTDADEVAQILWGGLHGLISLHLTKSHQEWVPLRALPQTARRAMDVLFHGILSESRK